MQSIARVLLELVDSLGLVANAEKVGTAFTTMMRQALGGHKNVADVRGEGLMMAVELAEDCGARKFFDPAAKIGPAIAAALLKRGIISRAMPQGDILGFAPPLCITESEARIVVDATREAVEEVLGTE